MLGTVPQSPVLFNDTVMANISYANRIASEADVFEACKAACIHDKILSFSDGYETRVGERGV
jgi:ABC-type multidrug transport system fused ATPase/permease subunit